MIKTELPSKITPDPIMEAVIEVRFVPKVDPDAVFHFAKKSKFISDYFEKEEELPIYQLPPSIRNTEPGLKYSPYFRLKGKQSYSDYLCQIGPRVFSIVTAGDYKGSADFLQKATDLFASLQTYVEVDKVERLGIRYIDFIEGNVFRQIKLNLTLPGIDLNLENSSVRVELPKSGRFGLTLQLASNAKVNSKKDGKEKTGSVLDIDAYTSDINGEWVSGLESVLKEGHHAQKSFFFALMNDEFWKTVERE